MAITVNQPVDLRQLPKVELHRHLELTLRLSTLKELAREAGMAVPTPDSVLRQEWLITEPMRDLETVLRKFTRTQAVLSSAEVLTRITYEAIVFARLARKEIDHVPKHGSVEDGGFAAAGPIVPFFSCGRQKGDDVAFAVGLGDEQWVAVQQFGAQFASVLG